eukprot:scaffold406812_cov19-Prasinocladus_malaysianus.AAC.1
MPITVKENAGSAWFKAGRLITVYARRECVPFQAAPTPSKPYTKAFDPNEEIPFGKLLLNNHRAKPLRSHIEKDPNSLIAPMTPYYYVVYKTVQEGYTCTAVG